MKEHFSTWKERCMSASGVLWTCTGTTGLQNGITLHFFPPKKSSRCRKEEEANSKKFFLQAERQTYRIFNSCKNTKKTHTPYLNNFIN